jgi:heme A synthase
MTRPARDQTPRPDSARRRGNGYLKVFYVLFLVFTIDVLLGKANIQFGWEVPYLLGDVPEFLLLLVVAVFLTLAALGRERDRSGDN